MTYNEILYMVLDELKLSSDDSYYTQDHIVFLLGKFRTFLLKQRYSDIKKQIPMSNYQTICLNLLEVPPIEGAYCEGKPYLRSISKIPVLMNIGNPRVYPMDYFQGEIAYISRDRMRYTGYNKYMKNIIYSTRDPEGYLFLKSANPQFIYLEKVKFSAIFEDPTKAAELQCPGEDGKTCNLEDMDFPIEDALVPPLIELVVKELKSEEYSPEDNNNNAKDDLSEIR